MNHFCLVPCAQSWAHWWKNAPQQNSFSWSPSFKPLPCSQTPNIHLNFSLPSHQPALTCCTEVSDDQFDLWWCGDSWRTVEFLNQWFGGLVKKGVGWEWEHHMAQRWRLPIQEEENLLPAYLLTQTPGDWAIISFPQPSWPPLSSIPLNDNPSHFSYWPNPPLTLFLSNILLLWPFFNRTLLGDWNKNPAMF